VIVEVECERCRGEGWIGFAPATEPEQWYETTCPKCNGNGTYLTDAADEIEDWMHDE
jgi:DnaJ-class molecular chaperone